IRDFHVTGVQTCALPIYLLGQQSAAEITYSALKARIAAGQVKAVSLGPQTIRAAVADSVWRPGMPRVWTAVRVPEDEQLIPLLRSEERRVGKSLSSRWPM